MIDPRDVERMAHALRLAKQGCYTTRPNPNVGCVVINTKGETVGSGFHARAGQAHAEILALQQAGDQARGGTVYVTLEPCCHQGKTGPCTQALIDAGVSRVVVAMEDPNSLVAGKGIQQLRDHGIEIDVNVLAEQASQLNIGFVKRMQHNLPWVTVKSAISLDGKTALHTGESKWITSSPARLDVQRLRAKSDVVMTGIGTLLMDDPSLNVRLSPNELGVEGEIIQPLRVVIDSKLQIPASAKMLTLDGLTRVYTNSQTRREDLEDVPACEIIRQDGIQDQVDMLAVLSELAKNEVNTVLVEAGARLVGNLMQRQLVDELIVYISPKLFGSVAKGISDLDPISKMDDHVSLEFTDIRNIGADLRISALIKH